MVRTGVPKRQSGQARRRLLFLSQSHSVSPEFSHPWYLASFLASNEP